MTKGLSGKIKIFILISCVLLFGIIGMFWGAKRLGQPLEPSPQLRVGTLLPTPIALPTFHLTDYNHKLFSHKQLYDQWSFVFFGYTHCPSLCPTTLGKLNELAALLGPSAQFIFISINPEQDTPLRLKDFLSQKSFNHAQFLGVTGSCENIQALAKTIGLFISENKIPINGHIEHSGTVLLINPEGKLAAIFTNPNHPQAIARL